MKNIKFKAHEPLDFKLPQATGWRLIIRPLEIEEKTETGIYMADTSRSKFEQYMSVGLVEQVGPLAYKQVDRLGEIPWCKEGDYVFYERYTGSRYKYKGIDFLLLNDDHVKMVLAEEDVKHLGGI